MDFLKDVKQWAQKSKVWLHSLAEKIRYAADVVDWFADTLDSLPLPEEKPGTVSDN